MRSVAAPCMRGSEEGRFACIFYLEILRELLDNYLQCLLFHRHCLQVIFPVMKLQINLTVSVALLTETAVAATCATTLKSSYPAPIVSDGWEAQLIVQGLSAPRSILFDSNGGLLVVQQGAGIVHLVFNDSGSTCLEVSKKTYLINSTAVRIRAIQAAERLLTSPVESRHRTLERWKDHLCILIRISFLVVLRCESCHCQ